MRHAYVVLLLAVALVSAACSSTVQGSAVKSTVGASGPALDFSQLDPGRFPTEASQPLGVTGDPLLGVVVEAQRMADYVVGPWEVDPAITGHFAFGAAVLPAAETLALIGPMDLAAAAGRNNLINAFASARTQENRRILLNAVLRFPDGGTARAAVTDMNEVALRQPGAAGPARELEIPGHPDTQASTYATVDGATGQGNAVRSFTAHGPYVLMQLAQSTEGEQQAADLVARSIDLQKPEIDKFRATDPSEFADISLDPSGLLARTIPMDGRDPSFAKNATYEQRGALHFQSDAARSATLFDETGVETVAMAATNVYETRDADGAKGILEGFYAEVSPTAQPANAVPNMPDSRCLGLADGGFYCLATADRYALEVSAPTLLATQQMTAAQYIMLMS
ncbi:DUF7373 family lipoprotein [Mycobacterium sp. IDR2000157661]|uniref:DUF7373 family lipoprotein n=1 Tax=Mycobacterium sp. IDR2000157661 TaxID=2867005 RepID=UPI001EEEACFC|nr:hypothetical protein [Mycobacterium sp. IDR2000157661]ULE34760.1 hypothetical protein K3G64_09340 [Mycobacterium sp. IDR2000157661]